MKKKTFGAYWFSTGTPTFLVRRLRNMHFDVRQFAEKTIYADASDISDYRADNPDPVPLLYQTGYLTIADADSEEGPYILGFPNEEVKIGFFKNLLPEYVPTATTGSGKDILALRSRILQGDTEGIHNVLTALFASIPYTTDYAPFEHYFQTVVYLVFTLLGQYAHCEVHSSRGRADCVLETDSFVYIFEFKVDKSAKEALNQIEAKDYAAPYVADERHIFKIGVNFDSEKRLLSEWLVE
ncbi:PD-(D/E)XK nuclease domain-containing protein [Selenomonas sp. KH1T6]|uniref:PD-(D/E)XK nuclease domain-containing protein n=1 Tax=Selenomonas sp. KH1T6 TaxID=3158784 RepID=UPI0008A725E7|nr:PD-(D/E)XK nuclease superfamily protein [Selenomonas ruminantium]